MPVITPWVSDTSAGPRARRTFRVGVVTDTHVGDLLPELPEGVCRALGGVDLILHAGDVTTRRVLDQLERVAPVVAVQGNHDRAAGLCLPTAALVCVAGVRLGVTHGVRGPATEAGMVAAGLVAGRPVMLGLARTLVRRFDDADCVVFGHFHLPYLTRVGSTLVFSPGAVYTHESDGAPPRGGLRAAAYRRFRRGLPASARVPNVGILAIRDGVISPRIVPVGASLR